jgi:hypothetical protein
MNKAAPIFSLLIYPTTLKSLLDEIISSGKFAPANTPISGDEQFIRELGIVEKALFTALTDVVKKRNVLLSSLTMSLLEGILIEEYDEKFELLNEIMMETIRLHPLTENLSHDKIGIREGHVIVLLAERRLDFFNVFKPDCANCPTWVICDHPDKVVFQH